MSFKVHISWSEDHTALLKIMASVSPKELEDLRTSLIQSCIDHLNTLSSVPRPRCLPSSSLDKIYLRNVGRQLLKDLAWRLERSFPCKVHVDLLSTRAKDQLVLLLVLLLWLILISVFMLLSIHTVFRL